MATAASDGERSMPRIADIDLRGVADALGDNSGETTWWYDPTNGQVEMTLADSFVMDGDDEDDPNEPGLVPIESFDSRNAYRDMVEFAGSVTDTRASDLLLRALGGRGAFRRFRDTLYEFPHLRQQWFVYSNAASECRAIDWLLDEGRIAPADAEAERATRTATIATVLGEIGSPDDDAFEESHLIDRWDEASDLIDAGRSVTILRDGRPWATISRHPTAPR